MLEPVDLTPYLWSEDSRDYGEPGRDALDWIICGGETGPGHRWMNPDWARDPRDQCRAAGVPFFMKQMSGREPIPDDLMVREFPTW